MLFFPLTWKDFFFFPFGKKKEKGNSQYRSLQNKVWSWSSPFSLSTVLKPISSSQEGRGSLSCAIKSLTFPRISPGVNSCRVGVQCLAAGLWMSREGDGACALLAFRRVTEQPPPGWFVQATPTSSLQKPIWVGLGVMTEVFLLAG